MGVSHVSSKRTNHLPSAHQYANRRSYLSDSDLVAFWRAEDGVSGMGVVIQGVHRGGACV